MFGRESEGEKAERIRREALKYLDEHPELIERHPAFLDKLRVLTRRKTDRLARELEEAVGKQSTEYRRGLDDGHKDFFILEERLKRDIDEAKKQQGYLRMALDNRDQQITDMRTRRLVPLFKAFEDSLFKDTTMIYLGPDLRPVYGTPKFLESLHIQESDLLSSNIQGLFDHLDEQSRASLINYANNPLQPPLKLKLNIVDGESRYVEVSTKAVYDAEKDHVGTFVIFSDVGMFSRWRSSGRGSKILESLIRGIYSSLQGKDSKINPV